MGPPACARASACRNFHRAERPDCNECGAPITGSHFHSSSESWRICRRCFLTHLPAIGDGSYRPATRILAESDRCRHHARCFTPAPYGMFEPKLCARCRRPVPGGHYHEVGANLRYCLACCLAQAPAA